MFLLILPTDEHCEDDEFQCKYIYQCIDKTKVHDDIEDCLDRTDEGLLIARYLLLSNAALSSFSIITKSKLTTAVQNYRHVV